jgi:hypothetical protein
MISAKEAHFSCPMEVMLMTCVYAVYVRICLKLFHVVRDEQQ